MGANSRTLLLRARALLAERTLSIHAAARNAAGDVCTPTVASVALSPLGALMVAAHEAGVQWFFERRTRNGMEPTGAAVQAVQRLAGVLARKGVSPWAVVADWNDATNDHAKALALFDSALAGGSLADDLPDTGPAPRRADSADVGAFGPPARTK